MKRMITQLLALALLSVFGTMANAKATHDSACACPMHGTPLLTASVVDVSFVVTYSFNNTSKAAFSQDNPASSVASSLPAKYAKPATFLDPSDASTDTPFWNNGTLTAVNSMAPTRPAAPRIIVVRRA